MLSHLILGKSLMVRQLDHYGPYRAKPVVRAHKAGWLQRLFMTVR